MLPFAPLCLLLLPHAARHALEVPSATLRVEKPAPCCAGEARIPIDAAHTPGDADSVFRIDAPGSYYLRDNAAGQAGKLGLEIAASNVTVDLMGFSLEGVAGSLDGISLDGPQEHVTIRNGVVTGFGGNGVGLWTGTASRLEGLRASDNGAHGLTAGEGSSVADCSAVANVGTGINAGPGSVVADCLASGNGVYGIWVSNDARIERCDARDNQSFGLYLVNSSVALDSTASSNGASGVRLGPRTEARRCTASWNGELGFSGGNGGVYLEGCVAVSNAEFGIRAGGKSYVGGNLVRDNGSPGVGGGIQVTGQLSLVEDNSSVGNDFAGYLVEGTRNILRCNAAADNGLNWSVVAGNACRVLIATTGAGIFGNAGGPAMGPNDPNANYSF